ncbi:alpha-1,2-fucosyltransferase [Halotia wernerae UHCC 0503]|nr:alpha-1,2-fucosyltransferase [Halotia wernerae UHCC 0503]
MIFISENTGRLGNQLTVFAHFIACAIENKLSIVNPSFKNYAKVFKNTSDDIFCRYPTRRLKLFPKSITRNISYLFILNLGKVLQKIDAYNYIGSYKVIQARLREDKYSLGNQDFLELAKNKVVFCRGYFFRDYQNVVKHADKIKAYFILNEQYQISVDNFINSIRDKHELVVGVHIRQGDYKEYQNGKWFYETSQYVKIIKDVKSLFGNQRVAFLICSDTRQEESAFSECNVFLSDKSAIEDCYLLSKCDYILGVPSSFSRWASFYGSVPLCVVRDANQEVNLNQFEVNYQLFG